MYIIKVTDVIRHTITNTSIMMTMISLTPLGIGLSVRKVYIGAIIIVAGLVTS